MVLLSSLSGSLRKHLQLVERTWSYSRQVSLMMCASRNPKSQFPCLLAAPLWFVMTLLSNINSTDLLQAYADIAEWAMGEQVKTKFDADMNIGTYRHHCTVLENIKARNPEKFHHLMSNLFQEATWVTGLWAVLLPWLMFTVLGRNARYQSSMRIEPLLVLILMVWVTNSMGHYHILCSYIHHWHCFVNPFTIHYFRQSLP